MHHHDDHHDDDVIIMTCHDDDDDDDDDDDQAAFPSVKTSQMASSRNFFLRRVRLTNIKDALTRFPLRFE